MTTTTSTTSDVGRCRSSQARRVGRALALTGCRRNTVRAVSPHDASIPQAAGEALPPSKPLTGPRSRGERRSGRAERIVEAASTGDRDRSGRASGPPPASWDEVVGQDKVVSRLQGARRSRWTRGPCLLAIGTERDGEDNHRAPHRGGSRGPVPHRGTRCSSAYRRAACSARSRNADKRMGREERPGLPHQ